MQAWSKHPDMIAAWTIALAFVCTIPLAPWERLRAAEARHDSDLRNLTFGPEGP